jgi:hypothetical protein
MTARAADGSLSNLLATWPGTTLAVLGVTAALVVVWVVVTFLRTPVEDKDVAGPRPHRTDGRSLSELLHELVEAAPPASVEHLRRHDREPVA